MMVWPGGDCLFGSDSMAAWQDTHTLTHSLTHTHSLDATSRTWGPASTAGHLRVCPAFWRQDTSIVHGFAHDELPSPVRIPMLQSLQNCPPLPVFAHACTSHGLPLVIYSCPGGLPEPTDTCVHTAAVTATQSSSRLRPPPYRHGWAPYASAPSLCYLLLATC